MFCARRGRKTNNPEENSSRKATNNLSVHLKVCSLEPRGGGGVLPIMAYTGRLHPKGVPFSGFR